MAGEYWIHVVDWERFQHPDTGRSTVPPWVKVYTEFHSNDGFLALSGHQRAVLLGIWLEYARSRRQLVLDTRSLSRRLALRVSLTTLYALNGAGFIHFTASKRASTEQNRTEKTVTRAVTVASYAEKPARKPRAENRLPADLKAQLAKVRGADGRTPQVLAGFINRGLPEAAFRNALEATHEAADAGRLHGTEAAYLVGTLKQLESSGQYGT